MWTILYNLQNVIWYFIKVHSTMSWSSQSTHSTVNTGALHVVVSPGTPGTSFETYFGNKYEDLVLRLWCFGLFWFLLSLLSYQYSITLNQLLLVQLDFGSLYRNAGKRYPKIRSQSQTVRETQRSFIGLWHVPPRPLTYAVPPGRHMPFRNMPDTCQGCA